MVYLRVIKRDGKEVPYSSGKIVRAVGLACSQAKREAGIELDAEWLALTVSNKAYKYFRDEYKDYVKDGKKTIPLRIVEKKILEILKEENTVIHDFFDDYASGRYYERLRNSPLFMKLEAFAKETDRDNANVGNNFSAKLLRSASESNKARILAKLPKHLTKGHEKGDWHIHDLDSFDLTTNCLHIPFGELMRRGFNTGYGTINSPSRIETAAEQACIVLQSSQNDMFGGQSLPNFDTDMAPMVELTREEIKAESYEQYVEDFKDEKRGRCSILSFEEYCQKNKARIEKKVEKHTRQAMQGVVYNLNTMHSRAGSQVPFSSVNIALVDSEDSAMICRIFLEEYDKGLGKGEQPIFPNIIFRCKKGINQKGDKYYYLFKLACKVAAKRMNPTFMNIDSSFNKPYYEQGYKPATMGCLDGKEVINYKYNGNVYIESFERAWERLSNDFDVKEQEAKGNYYIDLEGVKIYDTLKGYVKCYRIIRNTSDKWVKVKLEKGRQWLCTEDHPFEIIDKGVIHAKDLKIGDKVYINTSCTTKSSNNNYSKDLAWLMGLILCNGCLNTQLSISLGPDEKDIVTRVENIFNSMDINTETIEHERGKKGHYFEVRAHGNKSIEFRHWLIEQFEGINKIDRHIPIEIFNSAKKIKLAFLGGMIDVDGHINQRGARTARLQIGSTNKELALQQMMLIQTLGMKSVVYENYYNGANKNIRYRIESNLTNKMVKEITSQKKIDKFNKPGNKDGKTIKKAKIKSLEFIDIRAYSYDVTTESEHFEASGIYSHNCRTYLMKDVNGEPGVEGRGNNAPVTINLPRLALKVREIEDEDMRLQEFFNLFTKAISDARDICMVRYSMLKNLKVKDLPFVAKQGLMKGSENLTENDNIDEILKHGTWGLGFIGLSETLVALIGEHHGQSEKARKLGLSIIGFLRNKCDEYTEQDKMNWSCYASPAEGTSGRFTPMDKKIFGEVPGVTDKEYYTNSFHIPVGFEISIQDKLSIEAPYHALCNGGHISYVELDGVPDAQTIEDIITWAFNNTDMSYLGINFHLRMCKKCGNILYGGENTCECGSTEIQGYSRVTGYISFDERFGGGKSAERRDRISHNNWTKHYYKTA